MAVNIRKTIGELATESRAAARVFEHFGIDYACKGSRSLADASESAGVPVGDVVEALESEERRLRLEPGRDWQRVPVDELTSYIVEKHHEFTREELTRLDRLAFEVASKYGAQHPELLQVQDLLSELSQEMLPHMSKEERLIFPYLTDMETSLGRETAPAAQFSTVRNPIRMMSLEHDTGAEILRRVRRITNGFRPPTDACETYRTFLGRLQRLEEDLHFHMHLENNVLYPRALAIEVAIADRFGKASDEEYAFANRSRED